MFINSITPSKAFFRPGELIELLLDISSDKAEDVYLDLVIRHLDENPFTARKQVSLNGTQQKETLHWQAPAGKAGYYVLVNLLDSRGMQQASGRTAFDVLDKWTDYPRYGFMADFSRNRLDAAKTLSGLLHFHINGLQFYDWQYRHDQLLAPETDYIDPLGREMSLDTINSLVITAAKLGMASTAYLAVYAASARFWRENAESALYDKDGKTIPFGEDFLGLMNPAPGSPWREHLLQECSKLLEAVPFSGLQIDQYGEPRQVWDAQGKPVDLPAAFSDFIRSARSEYPEKTLVFNAVSNWPIETLAAAPLDLVYIEIWPPDIHYSDAARIVMNAVKLSCGKPVVIAIYIPADRPENVMQMNAVIAACGGTRIELGEDNRLLTDPYFPKHQLIPAALNQQLSDHYDYLVRYGEWFQGYNQQPDEHIAWADGILSPDFVNIIEDVWTAARKHTGFTVIHMVNFTGVSKDNRWDESHAAPAPLSAVSVAIKYSKKPSTVLWASPEQKEAGPVSIDFQYKNNEAIFIIPTIQLSGVIIIHD